MKEISHNTGHLYTWIRHERNRRDLSQSKLSQLCGFSQAQLSQWEHGKIQPEPWQEKEIQDALKYFDKLVASGEVTSFLKKSRWSESSSKIKSSKCLKGIDKQDVRAFANKKIKKQNKIPQLKINGISLFAGCGGMSLGFHNAGVNVLGHVEIDDDALHVYEENFPSSKRLGTNIQNISDSDLDKLVKKLGRVDIIFGGPPCQGFSLTGKRDVFDPRNQLYKDFVRFVKKFRPRVFVLENVRLLTSMKNIDGSLVISDILKTFNDLGYVTSHKTLNSMNYGVAQSRERVFVIGIDEDQNTIDTPTHPDPTHGNQSNDLFEEMQKILTMKDALEDLEHLESGEFSKKDPLHFAVSHPEHVIKMLRGVPQGASAHQNSDPNLRPKSGYNTTYKRLCWNEPASTISTTFGMISGSRNVHPIATRSLTIREAMRCQSFPDSFAVFGKLGSIRTMIGNAVPPKLAEAVARHIILEVFRS